MIAYDLLSWKVVVGLQLVKQQIQSDSKYEFKLLSAAASSVDHAGWCDFDSQ